MSGLPEMKLGDDAAQTFLVDPVEAAPAPKRVRASQPEEWGTGLEPVPTDLPETDLGGSQMTGWERASVLLSHWFRLATKTTGDLTANPGVIGSDPPESWVEYRAYVDSRAWIPEGYEGKWLVWVPVVYYNSIGCLGFVADGAGWLFKRMFRFIATLMIVAFIFVLWIFFS